MAFLDNSGDIILDAVLTDTGRFRLAKGDGSFRVVKFALGDDEINYTSYNNSHPSGSAYYDLDILQTPILEAFTDNAASLKSKLMSISRTNLLYLPVMKLNQTSEGTSTQMSTSGTFYVAVDKTTEDSLGNNLTGLIKGFSKTTGGKIRIDQGLDTNDIPFSTNIDSDLVESQYIIEIDNRLGNIVDTTTNPNAAKVSYVDDDNVASYYLSSGTDAAYVTEFNSNNNNTQSSSVIRGPRGTYIQFKIGSSTELINGNYLFEVLGSTTSINGNTYKFIDSIVRVTGATTGYKIDVPIRFLKL